MMTSSAQYLNLAEGDHLFGIDTGGVIPSQASHPTFVAAALEAQQAYDNLPGGGEIEYGMHVVHPLTHWGEDNNSMASQLGAVSRGSLFYSRSDDPDPYAHFSEKKLQDVDKDVMEGLARLVSVGGKYVFFCTRNARSYSPHPDISVVKLGEKKSS